MYIFQKRLYVCIKKTIMNIFQTRLYVGKIKLTFSLIIQNNISKIQIFNWK